MRTGLTALVFAAACCLFASAPAFGKEGVRARLEAPKALADAAPGSRLRVAWTLSAAPQLPVGGTPPPRRPSGADDLPVAFGASGVYIRVSAGDGRSKIFRSVSTAGPARYPRGHYVADVTVPKGGVSGIAIGLDGWRYVNGRPAVEADVFFPIDNDPFAGPAVDSGAARYPWVAGGLLLGAVAALGLVVAARRHPAPRAG